MANRSSPPYQMCLKKILPIRFKSFLTLSGEVAPLLRTATALFSLSQHSRPPYRALNLSGYLYIVSSSLSHRTGGKGVQTLRINNDAQQ